MRRFWCDNSISSSRPLQYYDATDTTETAARQLAEYIAANNNPANVEQLRTRANAIAKQALAADEGLLAVALAAPAHTVAVVAFRDQVQIQASMKAAAAAAKGTARPTLVSGAQLLSPYWRELGEAWNRTDGAQQWNAPFRDCGALTGRWLWPFSVTVQMGPLK